MPGEKEELKDFLDDTFKTMDAVLADQHPELTQREVGLVHYVGYGIVRVSGLPDIGAEEIVLFPKNVQGLQSGSEVGEAETNRPSLPLSYAFPPSLKEMQNEKSLPGDVAHHPPSGP